MNIKHYKLKITQWFIAAGILLAAPAIPAQSNGLFAVVVPGYQFPLDGSVSPTYQLLNQLAQPTILIYGSLSGSNSLAPGSVNGNQLANSAVDGVTIDFNGSSPRALEVMRQGVHTNNVDTNALAFPLVGGFDRLVQIVYGASMTNDPTGLIVQADTNYFGTNADGLTLKTFTSVEYPFTNGLNAISTNHWFTNTPSAVRPVLVCKTAEAGYVLGDEVAADATVQDTASFGSVANYGASSNNVFYIWNVSQRITIHNKATGAATTLTGASGARVSNWNLKIYARP